MTTKANAIANRLRQIPDRSRPTTKAGSAGHPASAQGLALGNSAQSRPGTIGSHSLPA